MKGRRLIQGTFWVFLAESLLFPAGILIAAFLTRNIGPQGYGLFILTVSLIAWVQWSIGAAFTRATIKFVGETSQWRSVGATATTLYFVVGCVAMFVVWFSAPLLASLFKEPVLTSYLRLFSVDIPIFSLAIAYRNILIGAGRFKRRALVSAGYWLTKLILIPVLVTLGFSIKGAILGSIGASVIRLALGYFHVRLLPFQRSNFSIGQLWSYAAPLFLFGISLRFYERLDLFVLKILNGSIELTGIYGASQNIALVPGILAMAFAPLLLSSLTQLRRSGEEAAAKKMAKNAMRFALCLLPFAGMAAGARTEIISLVYGPLFLSAADFLAILAFGAVAIFMVSIATVMLVAIGKPGWTFAVAGPLVPLALIGHILFIPRFGALAASLVTLTFSIFGALVAMFLVYRFWKLPPPMMTLVRSFAITAIIYALTSLWPLGGFLVLVKLLIMTVVMVACFFLLGEFNSEEILLARSPFLKKKISEQSPAEA